MTVESVYEAVMKMDKEEFTQFCEHLYLKGNMDGSQLLDDSPWIRHRLADFPIEEFEKIWDMK